MTLQYWPCAPPLAHGEMHTGSLAVAIGLETISFVVFGERAGMPKCQVTRQTDGRAGGHSTDIFKLIRHLGNYFVRSSPPTVGQRYGAVQIRAGLHNQPISAGRGGQARVCR